MSKDDDSRSFTSSYSKTLVGPVSFDELLKNKKQVNYRSITVSPDNSDESADQASSSPKSYKSMINVFILFVMNLINVTDRYVVSSVLTDVEKFFNVSKSVAGLIQTAFLLVYMAFCPINGYLGDRLNRKYLLIASIIIWIISIIGGSFIPQNMFWLFVLSRCLFGVATASFETIAVPIIGDTYSNDDKARLRSLIVFNLGPPLGNGLSFLIGTISKELRPNDWRFAMRITPIFLFIILILIIFGYEEPIRQNRQSVNVNNNEPAQSERTFKNDLKVLFKNKTFVLLTIAWTCGLASLSNNFKSSIQGRKLLNFIFF